MKYIVYNTINTKNNKVYIGVHKTENPDIFDGYIGCGVIVTRPSSYMNPTTPFHYAVKKYGTSCFKRVILEVFDSLEEALELEAKLVTKDFINRIDTYNTVEGGGIMSHFTIEVHQYSLDGYYLKTWESIVDASDFYGISDTAISRAIKAKGSCIKYFWSTEKNTKINTKEYIAYIGQKVYQYTAIGKCINTFETMVHASKFNNVPLQLIERAVKGGYKVGEFYYSTDLHETYCGKSKVSLKNKSIYIYSLEGIYITELKNSKEIYDFFKLTSTSSITTAIRKGIPYKNWQISLEKVNSLPEVINKRNINKKVAQYTLEGNFVREFKSITEACNEFGTGVQKVLRGQQKQCKNFIFRYII